MTIVNGQAAIIEIGRDQFHRRVEDSAEGKRRHARPQPPLEDGNRDDGSRA